MKLDLNLEALFLRGISVTVRGGEGEVLLFATPLRALPPDADGQVIAAMCAEAFGEARQWAATNVDKTTFSFKREGPPTYITVKYGTAEYTLATVDSLMNCQLAVEMLLFMHQVVAFVGLAFDYDESVEANTLVPHKDASAYGLYVPTDKLSRILGFRTLERAPENLN